ncbi:hypothetical protein RND81_03G073500 [Saponaria officinalis]|uniref:Uncharacterized protein n=1 Tax=Saponaria officinalis TaxID=3572 RepID=A0AAW1M5H0_SAPOF
MLLRGSQVDLFLHHFLRRCCHKKLIFPVSNIMHVATLLFALYDLIFVPVLTEGCGRPDAFGIAEQNLIYGFKLSRVLPPFLPFTQAFKIVITAALTGSLYYIAASPKAHVLQSRFGRENPEKLFAGFVFFSEFDILFFVVLRMQQIAR